MTGGLWDPVRQRSTSWPYVMDLVMSSHTTMGGYALLESNNSAIAHEHRSLIETLRLGFSKD